MQLPSENSESYRTGGEESNLLIKANEWRIKLQNKLKAKNSKRDFEVFGENLEGKSILLSRYLRQKGLKPPT
jgi:hypothetical protein